jgi:hypothetical protein
LAFLRNNITLCNTINATNSAFLINSTGGDIGEGIQNCRDQYYMQKAIANSSFSNCEKIANDETKKGCIFLKEGLCDSFVYTLNGYFPGPEINLRICKALQSRDSSICDSLSELDKKYCLNLVLYFKALAEKDINSFNQWSLINEELEGIKVQPILKAMVLEDESLCYNQKDLCKKKFIA